MSNHDRTTACRRARPSRARCGCGQELDVCAGDHCPRCGAHLDQDPAVSAWLALARA